jgi:uncharacterized protein YbjT (DUF2867 family)
LLTDDAYETIVALVRRPLELEHPKLTQHEIDFEEVAELSHLFKAQDLFCCLGTTMAKSKTKEAFKHIDYELPLAVARVAAARGFEQMLLVTSAGSTPKSRFSFYLRVKGELEVALGALPFSALHIFRPSFLGGKRAKSRGFEGSMVTLFKAFPMRRFRTVDASTVATFMVECAKRSKKGTSIYENSDILSSRN